MNERIKELSDIAYKNHLRNNPESSFGRRADYDTKFAELIVKECIVHGKLTQSQTVVNGSEEYNAGREMGIEVFMNQIRKHFGVE